MSNTKDIFQLFQKGVRDSNLKDFLSHVCSLLIAMYEVEINVKLGMGNYKTAKKVPVPLKSGVFYAAADAVQQCLSSPSDVPISSSRAGWDHKVWSEDESVVEFMYCLMRVYHKASQNVEMGEGGNMVFDKVDPFCLYFLFWFRFGHQLTFHLQDDYIAMHFVCAASNLRAAVFGIARQSFHECKGIAGSIVPAIATTNAIIAGVQVLGQFYC